MTTEKESNGQRTDQMLTDLVRDADEYYQYLNGKHASETRLDVAVVSLVVWFSSFAVIGLSAFAIFGRMIYYLVIAFLIAVVIAGFAGVFTYTVRRSRKSRFQPLGDLVKKVKEGGHATSEDGLRLMDAMNQAALVSRKRKLDSALEYGLLTFALVALVGSNAGIGALAGVIVYLYYRFETLREYERAEEKYDASKRELLLSL